MRILILGAGGIGGYIGARLLATGQADVSFLVRERRLQQLQEHGLQVESPLGNVQLAPPPALLASSLAQTFDVLILSCKAYDLDSAMDAIAPAVGAHTLILPFLNGVAHLEVLAQRFGPQVVGGGVAQFSATLSADGRILHLNDFHRLTVGSHNGQHQPALALLEKLFAATPITFRVSPHIEQEMWNKFIFLTTLAAGTSSMRAAIGDILACAGGQQFILGIWNECLQVARAQQREPEQAQMQSYLAQLTETGSTHTASLLRDLEGGGQTEAAHIVGDMVHRAQAAALPVPLLELAWLHLQASALRRARLAT